MDTRPFLDFCAELAGLSGSVIRPWFGNPDLPVETKADDSPVTQADRAAEQVLRERIAQRFPDHGILGEEFGAVRPDAPFQWILDPIDGTKAFAAACPLFGTLIGLLHEGRPLVGCIHQPILGQLMLGDGTRTTLNGRTVRLRPSPPIDRAVLTFSDPYHAERYQDGTAFHAVARRARVARTWADCYGYLLLSSGWIDAVVDPVMNPWDLLPLIPVVQGAGGVITDWQGRDAGLPGASSCVAAGADLHAFLIDALNP